MQDTSVARFLSKGIRGITGMHAVRARQTGVVRGPGERRVAIAVASLGILVALVSEWVYDSLARPTFWVPDLLAACSLFGCAAWLLMRSQLRLGVLLALVGVAWVLPNLIPGVPVLSVVHRVLLSCSLLALPTGRLTSPVRRSYVALCVVALLAPDPTAPEWLLAGGCGLAAVAVLDRRRGQPLAVPFSAGLAMAALGAARLLSIPEKHPLVLTALYALLVAGSALAAAWTAGQQSDADGRLEDGAGTVVLGPAEVVRRTLGGFLDTPHLRLVFLTDDGLPVDELGRTAAPPDDRTLVVTSDGARLGGGSRPLPDIGPAHRLIGVARRHALLRKDLRDTAEELAESRQRLRSVEDEVRLGLAVELATGPVAALQSLIGRLDDQELLEARSAVESAHAELTRFALGLGPALLESGSLQSAVEGLAEHSPLAVTVDVRTVGPVDADSARLVYFVCAEALANAAKHADAARVEITVRVDARGLRVEVVDDGRGGATWGSGLTDLADRVAQRGGQLTLDSRSGLGTTLTAVAPGSDHG